jgi:aminoglycoside phosphotransferase (APT) family kinase protein
MPKENNHPPSIEALGILLSILSPGSKLIQIHDLPGSFSNYTHLVEARKADLTQFLFVVRRYAVFGSYDRGEKASREYKMYEFLAKNGFPAPKPLYLDVAGEVLGLPGIVTSYVPGNFIQAPQELKIRAKTLARILAQIHLLKCDSVENHYLLDANMEASWFLRSNTVPAFMKNHPLGESVWHKARETYPHLSLTKETLVHLDYCPGNILWENGNIAAVIDWEEAAYGDPAIDVAYCRMNLILDGLDQAADEFIQEYEAVMGKKTANLGFWMLAAAARPMFDPDSWEISPSPKRERFAQFITDAIQLVGCG